MNSFEQAILIRKDLEARIRVLERMEGDKINDMIADYAKREDDYLDIVRCMHEDYDKYKSDVAKEFKLRDHVQKRLEEHIGVLQRELILSQNIIKNPNVFGRVNENMVSTKTEEYHYFRQPAGEQHP